MTQPRKFCPQCGQPTPVDAMYCAYCGTALHDTAPVRTIPDDVPVPATPVDSVPVDRRVAPSADSYDRQYGETDLLESEIGSRQTLPLIGGILGILIVLCIGVVVIATLDGNIPGATTDERLEDAAGTPLASSSPQPFFTNTPRPTLDLFTVTPAPPTPTATETPGPCQVTVQAGDGLIGLAGQCGHRSMDVIPLIVELNGLSAPENIQVGQELIIPWPTPTIDPNVPTATTIGASGGEIGDGIGIAAALPAGGEPNAENQATATPPIVPTETMLPGVAWHTVQPDENMIIVADTYNTNAETLAQLNPEIAFSQCDFSLDMGGPRCTVFLSIGQRMRVPASTPTPTLSPTLSGSETPTPTATPTFNAPNPLSPPDRALFLRDEIITLRWNTTGSLDTGDVYRIQLRDLTTGTVFSADTTDLSFILPVAWQGDDARLHEYEWTVSVYTARQPDTPTFTTPPRLFSWEGRQTP